MSDQSDNDISWGPPLVTFERTARRSSPSLYKRLPRHDDGREQPLSSYMVLATGPTPSWSNHMFLMPSYKHLRSAYTNSSHRHNSPQPRQSTQSTPCCTNPTVQSTTWAKYFHVSFTHHILQPPRSNTTNTRNIDRFRWAVHHVSNI